MTEERVNTGDPGSVRGNNIMEEAARRRMSGWTAHDGLRPQRKRSIKDLVAYFQAK